MDGGNRYSKNEQNLLKKKDYKNNYYESFFVISILKMNYSLIFFQNFKI